MREAPEHRDNGEALTEIARSNGCQPQHDFAAYAASVGRHAVSETLR